MAALLTGKQQFKLFLSLYGLLIVFIAVCFLVVPVHAYIDTYYADYNTSETTNLQNIYVGNESWFNHTNYLTMENDFTSFPLGWFEGMNDTASYQAQMIGDYAGHPLLAMGVMEWHADPYIGGVYYHGYYHITYETFEEANLTWYHDNYPNTPIILNVHYLDFPYPQDGYYVPSSPISNFTYDAEHPWRQLFGGNVPGMAGDYEIGYTGEGGCPNLVSQFTVNGDYYPVSNLSPFPVSFHWDGIGNPTTFLWHLYYKGPEPYGQWEGVEFVNTTLTEVGSYMMGLNVTDGCSQDIYWWSGVVTVIPYYPVLPNETPNINIPFNITVNLTVVTEFPPFPEGINRSALRGMIVNITPEAGEFLNYIDGVIDWFNSFIVAIINSMVTPLNMINSGIQSIMGSITFIFNYFMTYMFPLIGAIQLVVLALPVEVNYMIICHLMLDIFMQIYDLVFKVV